MSGVRITIKPPLSDAIRVERGVQRNSRRTTKVTAPSSFLFAVARGVQRNAAGTSEFVSPVFFYSLSRGAYSGTLPPPARL